MQTFDEAGARIAAQLLVLVLAQAREDRPALRRGDRATPGDDGRVGQRLGQVGEQLGHRRAVLHPGVGGGRYAFGAFDIGRAGNAQHGIVRGVERRVGVGRRIGRDERQVAGEGQVDQDILGRLLDRVVAADDLDIEPVGEQRLQAVAIGLGLAALSVGDEPGERAFGAGGERDEPLVEAVEIRERDVRRLLDRSVQVCQGNKLAQIGIALLVLGEQHEPVDRRLAPKIEWPGDRQNRADDRLYALGEAGVAERHCPVESVAVGERDRRKAKPRGAFGDGPGLHRAFEHGEGRQDPERDVRLAHSFTMGISSAG